MTANGDERKQIWATEFGALTAGTVTERVDPERQAAILRHGYRLFSTEPDGSSLLGTRWPLRPRDPAGGLVRPPPPGRARTPSWDAYRQAVL